MQILVLHGRQSNEMLANFQMSGMKQAVGKEADFHFIEGGHVWSYVEGFDNHDVDPMTLALAKGKDFKMWHRQSSDDQRDRVQYFKIQDPTVKWTYDGSTAAVTEVLDYIDKQGPIDVVVGVFEGSIVVHLAIARLVREGRPIPWRLSVFFGSMCIRDDNLIEPFSKQKVAHPSVHIFGKTDELMYYQRTAAGRIPPEDYYEDSFVMEHSGGHQLPGGADPKTREIYQIILAEMKYHCGLQRERPPRLPNPPKPTSMLLKNLQDMSARKLRVLALCGGHSCKAVINFQTSMLKRALGKDAEWTFVEGNKEWFWYEGEPTLGEAELMLSKGTQVKNWYMDTCHEAGGVKTDRTNRDKQFDPLTTVEYKEVEEVVEYWKNWIIDNGPFDVVVGFSQACILLHLLIGHLRNEPPRGAEKYSDRWMHARYSAEQMPWRCSVLVSGMHIRDKRYFHLFDKKSPHPTIQVYGKSDEYYEYGRTGFGIKPQEEYYVDPVVLVHEQGHEFPTAMPRAKKVYDTIVAEIWRHCGGRPES